MRKPNAASGEEPVEVTPVEARQAAGPRSMMAVLASSLLLSAAVGVGLLIYFLS